MGRRIAIALIGLFLISLIPAGDFDINRVDDSTEALDRSVKRVEIAADPNSIQDLQSPKCHRDLKESETIPRTQLLEYTQNQG